MGNKLKKPNYFAGWYFKHTNNKNTVAIIPSYHVDDQKNIMAVIQIVTDFQSYSFDFPEDQFFIDQENFVISIGDNTFTKSGIELNINTKETVIVAKFDYSGLTPPQSDIMGPFRLVPFMQCSHGLLSFRHTVNGFIKIDDEKYDFNNGIGYIESDKGNSFPERYLWTQCNIENQKEELSIMVSIATVKALCLNFTGTVCCIYYNGTEYRIATYKGAKIIEFSEKKAIIKQGKMLLTAEQLSACPYKLNAPVRGIMNRVIRESPSCKVKYEFTIDGQTVFDKIADRAGFEFSDSSKVE